MNTSPYARDIAPGSQRVDDLLRYQAFPRLVDLPRSPPGQTPTSVTRSRVSCGTRAGARTTAEAQAEVEAALPFNCEHVVPQSWFGKQKPMRGDLHHLFVCEARCNSFRGNTPYMEFADFPEPATGAPTLREVPPRPWRHQL